MSIVKFKHYPSKSFNNLLDDFFPGFTSIYRDEHANGFNHFTPVNVKETERGYQLEVVAPGFTKEDFKISLDKNLLTISADKKVEENKAEKDIRREYRFQSFKRSFTLTDKIDTEKIEAKYDNGVLFIMLSKKEEVKAAVKEIAIQ
jgi:HSP20 family protein